MLEIMSEYKVAEIFTSINGESRRAGETAVFVRFTGCNLRCNYCDTLWALEKDAPFTAMSGEEIYDYIRESGIKNVTLTGGEPLIQPGVNELIERLLEDENLRVEIETNGAVDIRPFMKASDRLSFTVDYKCPGSGMESGMVMSNFEAVGPGDTVKFVVSDEADLDKMCEIVNEYHLTEKAAVYVGAVFGRIDPQQIVEYMLKHKMNDVRLQLQMHKFIWAPDERGV